MLGWGKGSDIRATYERRREQIRQGVLGAGRAAGSRINRAGAAAVAGLRATGAAV